MSVHNRLRSAGARDLSVLQNVQTSSGLHTAFCSVVIGGSFPGCNAGGVWIWSLPLIYCPG